ncbi:tetratricopeptide repeat protein [Leptothoe sp. PORK10 BA2]|uniref:tetratricopeptide repeat protein n=1 Tax=Leptothoe sp. PORK10 BA2 TaxID=3110254 RepID=UPI002B20CEFC|nr:tetratricopeptide repeat protein [Leptothoe sp. PORK10 BA2]MEA5464770.1 tetratricopeptide repeat protein [Leptothoe sp. PORK10 BA2]
MNLRIPKRLYVSIVLGIIGFCLTAYFYIWAFSPNAQSQTPQQLIIERTAVDEFIEGLSFTTGNAGFDPNLAIANFTQAIQMDPDYAEAYFERGRERSYRDLHGAIKDYSEAIRINLNYAEAYFKRAEAFYGLEENQKAINDYSSAIEISPQFSDAYFQRAIVLGDLGDLDAAVKDFVEVIKLDPFRLAYQQDNLKIASRHRDFMQENPDFAYLFYQKLARFYLSKYGTNPETIDNLEDFHLSPQLLEKYQYFNGKINTPRSRNNIWYGAETLDKAIQYFSNAISYNPEYIEAYFYRGYIYFLELEIDQKNNLLEAQRAISNFTKVLELNPKFSDAYYYRALVESRIGQDEKAIKDIVQALEIEPGADIERAEEFIKVLSQTPNDVSSFLARGKVRFKLEDFVGALRDFSQVIYLNPEIAEAYFYRGLIRNTLPAFDYDYRNWDTTASYIDYSKAIELDPKFVGAYFERGFHSPDGPFERIQATINDMYKALNYAPNFAEAYYAIAEAKEFISYFETEEISEERLKEYVQSFPEEYTEAIRLNHDFAFTYYRAGIGTCGSRGVIGDVRNNPHFYLDVDSGYYFTSTTSIYGLHELGNEQATKQLRLSSEQIDSNAQNSDVFFSRAFAFLRLGKLDKANEDFAQVLKLNPQDADAYYGQGLAQYRNENYSSAIESLTKSIDFNPYLADTFLIRGLAEFDQQNYQKALEDLTQAIRLDPEFAEAYFIRARIYEHFGYKNAAIGDYGWSNLQWPCYRGCCGGAGMQGSPETFLSRGRALARRGDKRAALENLRQAADLFQAQGNTSRYQEVQNLIRKTQ